MPGFEVRVAGSVAVSFVLAACADPMSGVRFACDPDGPSTCLPGHVCVAVSGHTYKGVCTPAGEVGDNGPSDPGVEACEPQCTGKVCGEDGCGGSCGTCGKGKTCQSGACVTTTCPTGWVLVPAGEFEMGSPPEEPGHDGDEVLHHVKLNRAFCLKATEVRQDEWKEAFAGWNPSSFGSCDACPVETVSWYDSVAYSNELSKSAELKPCYVLSEVKCEDGTQVGTAYTECTNKTRGGIDSAKVGLNGVSTPYECEGFRLPTEAEWEYAARAGTTQGTWKGDLVDPIGKPCDEPVLDPIAWYWGNSCTTAPSASCSGGSGCTTHAVGASGHDNPWGLYDMLGNVWEWCWDWYAAYQGDGTDPIGYPGSYRVIRGGGWISVADLVRAANRNADAPGARGSSLDFRPARSIP